MKRLASFLGAAVLALSFVTQLAFATQVLYRTPQQLGVDSELVVMGKVQSVESYWNESKTKILTEARIEVRDTYKGAARGVVSVMQLGGVVGNVRMTVHGAVQWHSGEEVVLFLEPFQNDSFQVSGFSQGKFKVERDPDTGVAFITRPESGDVQLIGAPDGDARAASKTKRQSIDSFIGEALGRR